MATDQYIEHLKKNPLYALSMYSGIQSDVLRGLEAEILQALDCMTSKGGEAVIDGRTFNHAYGRFWLWVLGAYEVVRTLAAKRCEDSLAPDAASRMKTCRDELKKIRVPFAKLELPRAPGQRQGDGEPIGGELSIYSIEPERRDMGFKIQGQLFWMRETINMFRCTIDSISLDDVLKEIPRRPPEPVGTAHKGA